MRYVLMLALLTGLVAGDVRAQNQQADFNKPFPPHKVIGNVYNLTEKYARLEKGGGPNPFIDPEGFKQYVDRSEKTFQTRLAEQKQAATK